MSTTTTTPCPPPDRSLLQRLRALETANDVRIRKAELKRQIKAGEADIIDILRNPPLWLENAKVTEMLLCVPKLGPVRVSWVLKACEIAPSKTVGGISSGQRSRLIGWLR